ncbi:MAG: DNA translocase FtsK [Candidatus Marinamargulisbacteria bacterium]
MTKKKPRASKSPSASFHDAFFIGQLISGIVIFFSIYSNQLMGPFGQWVQRIGIFIFGDTISLLPWVLFATSPLLIRNPKQSLKRYSLLLGFFCFFSMTFIDACFDKKMLSLHGEISTTLPILFIEFGSQLFGPFGARLFCFLVALILGSQLVGISIDSLRKPLKKTKKIPLKKYYHKIKYTLFYTTKTPKKRRPPLPPIKKTKDTFGLKKLKETSTLGIVNAQKVDIERIDPAPEPPSRSPSDTASYQLPPLDLLTQPRSTNANQIETDMRANASILEMALDSFNVNAKVVNVTIGPSVSRFELQPGEGVKISKITNLNQDIALKLAVPTVRIEAPIPGKALIGIEVPNADVAPLTLRSIIQPNEFLNNNTPLECILGQRITGEGVTMNLNKMPHILVAGSTGSGKSVCINAIILSILMKATPNEVKFLMIDPKKVELSLYADIPHLLAPVVTNPHKAAATLKQWALVEMERRYELFTEHGVKDLAGFNAHAKQSKDLDPIPYIVVIIDEFADLMMVASQEVENTICRLAQMARATGIHLVIATQRPSVNVVTGLIKANVPSRISFAVQSQIDSRTVLDMAGAEKLLGRGDMLYMPVGASKPDRVQGVFVSEDEVNAVVKFIKHQSTPDYVDEILSVEPLQDTSASTSDEHTNQDALFNEAKEIIQSTQYASTSYLQRKLRIGYNRAARLMDELEAAGVISEYDSDSKKRNVMPM